MLKWEKVEGSTLACMSLRLNGMIADVWRWGDRWRWTVFGIKMGDYIAGGSDDTCADSRKRALKVMECELYKNITRKK